MSMLRIGHGYDAHRLVPGRRMILGGVDVPHHLGLDGHSDADVLTHAVMDALLGALSLGDIGLHFPPGDAAFAGADSIKLLQKVVGMIKEQGFSLCNLDATIIAQKPKLAGHIPKMRENLAAAIGVPVGLCSVKATTEEGMGFTGREEGVAAHCVLLLAKENRENKRPV